MGPVSLRGAGEEERFPHSEGPTHRKGISRGGERPSGNRGIRGEYGWGLPHLLRPW